MPFLLSNKPGVVTCSALLLNSTSQEGLLTIVVALTKMRPRHALNRGLLDNSLCPSTTRTP